MNLKFVEAFYWVAELKSVTRAAEKLFLTQSAMSSRIAVLEEELGMSLLDRRDKQVRLTASGLRFLGYAQKLLELQREVKAEMAPGALRAATLRIGAIESVLHSWLVPFIEDLRAEHAGLELELTVETTPVLLDQIRRGALDLVFAALPSSTEGLRSEAFPPMDMVFVGRAREHRRRVYRLDDMADMDILTFQRGSQPHVGLLDVFRHAALEPRRVHAVSSISAMAQLVECGFGVATLPREAALRFVEVAGLKILNCSATLNPLPIFATHRLDPGTALVQTVLREAASFVARREVREKRTRARRRGTSGETRVPRLVIE
jgi:DNA-binding transcriptional LysR family regulator